MNNSSKFKLYLHPEVFTASKDLKDISFNGFSMPYFKRVIKSVAKNTKQFSSLSLRRADFDDFKTVHTNDYIEKIKLMAIDKLPKEEMPRLSVENTGLEYFIPAYEYSLGGLYQAYDEMKAGIIKRSFNAFIAGHHAYADWGHGYCMVNTLCASFAYAQKIGFRKIVILDWDFHHGDGSQSVLANNPDVYYISIHNGFDLYMSGQKVLEAGTVEVAEMLGHQNIPLADYDLDDAFINECGLKPPFFRAHESHALVKHAIDNLPFKPDLFIIFCGIDSHIEDCGEFVTNWHDDDYDELTKMVIDKTEEFACPLVSVNGGGYTFETAVRAYTKHINLLSNYCL